MKGKLQVSKLPVDRRKRKWQNSLHFRKISWTCRSPCNHSSDITFLLYFLNNSNIISVLVWSPVLENINTVANIKYPFKTLNLLMTYMISSIIHLWYSLSLCYNGNLLLYGTDWVYLTSIRNLIVKPK